MIYHFGECTFDTQLYTLQRGGLSIRLRPKVFRVCLYLLEHRDRVVSREELCNQVWGGRCVSQATLEGVIRSVREALGDSGRTQGIIQTSRGYGYRFVAGVEEGRLIEVREELPSAATLSRSRESGIHPRTPSIAVGIELVQGWEATSTSGPSGEVKGWQAGTPNYAPDRAVIIAGEQERAANQDRSARSWLIAVGQGLAVITLLLVGAFGPWWGTSHQAMAPLERSQIAVLPLIDLSAEANQAYLADGIMEELIAQLSHIPGLTVIARTSVLKYKGSLKDVATIGRELGVHAILEGSIRKMDNQVRVSVQLIDVASQGHLWSQEYTRELTGVFATESDIATHLANGLRAQLTAQPLYNRFESESRRAALAQTVRHGK